MQRGPKLKNPATKKLAGTYKECVDGTTEPVVQLPLDKPVAPDWLSDGGRKVWSDDLARVAACGAREPDSHFFAIYCEMMARFITCVMQGDAPNAASVSELRKQMEMLGIAGAKARLARTSDSLPPSNPFAKYT